MLVHPQPLLDVALRERPRRHLDPPGPSTQAHDGGQHMLCMHMSLDRRLQILLDAERHARLVAVAQERGVSVATVVREAIDRGLPAPDTRRRAAASRLLAAEPMPVPDRDALAAELADLRTRR